MSPITQAAVRHRPPRLDPCRVPARPESRRFWHTAVTAASPATLAANAAVAAAYDLTGPSSFADATRGLLARRAARSTTPRARWCGTSTPSTSCRASAADRQPEPVAAGAAQRHPRPVRGHRRHLPGARLRHLQHDADRGPDRLDRGRPADRARDRRGRDGLRARSTSATSRCRRVIFTHSHLDHFGGVLGVLAAEDGRGASVPIVAPRGFMEEATSENVMAGVAMGRRASYMYGTTCRARPRGLRRHRARQGRRRRAASASWPPTVLVDRTTAGDDARRRALRVPVHARLRGARRADLLPARPARRTAAPRSSRTPCTTSTRCAAPRCATR